MGVVLLERNFYFGWIVEIQHNHIVVLVLMSLKYNLSCMRVY